MRLIVIAWLILWGCRADQNDFRGVRTEDAVPKKQSRIANEPVDEPTNEEEWTVAPPARGKPKVPGPPFPYLNEDSKRGLFDKIRKFRWQVWEYEQAVIVEKEYLDHWLYWERVWSHSHAGLPSSAIRSDGTKICGDWGGDQKKVYAEAGTSWFAWLTSWVLLLQKLISQYETLHPTPGVPARLSFGNEALVRSKGGEATSSWLAKLETIVEEIAEIERSNGEGIRQLERRFLETIEGCSADMTLSICPHPAISWNIKGGICFVNDPP